MPKRIDLGEDLKDTASKTGIPVDVLKKAEAGQIELTRAQLEKLRKALKGKAPGPIDIA